MYITIYVYKHFDVYVFVCTIFSNAKLITTTILQTLLSVFLSFLVLSFTLKYDPSMYRVINRK